MDIYYAVWNSRFFSCTEFDIKKGRLLQYVVGRYSSYNILKKIRRTLSKIIISIVRKLHMLRLYIVPRNRQANCKMTVMQIETDIIGLF